ncbi:amino acid/polyamine transporter I [Exophiala viscosa]|uniref:Amino acid/polyamine transporter I n=1 Tax=Exophiala viscosa TaxID=2486360 RepID=A0AAN6DNI6_9EURO|nr:amino acid/polyamine transporter I [Exophiala viscosa]KAI1628393.1 amino acid/polyamine transporter I [Exophiala viscosa]
METSKDDSVSANNDEGRLISLGHKPELKRTYTFWSLMAYQTTILCSWSCNIVMFYYIFTLGGPVCLVWGTVLVTIGQLFVMSSLAEYCSIWPTAGGQQFYTQVVAPEGSRRFLSYLVGWCVLVGEISTSSSCALNSAEIVAALVEIIHPEIDWKPYMTFLIYTGFLVAPALSNLLPRYLPALQVFGAFFNISNGLIWAIVFLVMAEKNSGRFVFTEFLNSSGWTSKGWVFILSMYVPIYGLYGSDGVMHLVEEMKNASRDAPRVMVWSMVWAGITAWLSAIVMCFTVGPKWEDYLEATSSYVEWFMDALDSTYGGGIWCAVMMMGLNYLIIVNMNTAGSRLAWSMARDRAFPFSNYFAHVSRRFTMPLRAMMAVIVINLLVGLLVLGSDLAFYAIISGGGVALQVSYCVPILCVVLRGRKHLPPRPHFDLGRWGYTVNILSLLWSVIVLLFYIFPQYVPVVGDLANMNWAIAILGGVVLFGGVYWLLKGRYEYLVFGNSILDDNVVVHGDARVIGRDAATTFGKPSTEKREEL